MKVRSVSSVSFWCNSLLVLGIIFRLLQYLSNRALWLDEAMISLNIVQRDYAGLLLPLDWQQVSPIGFLVLEKISVNLFGSNEFALRLLPLLAGIGSLILFGWLARRILDERAALIAMILFVFNRHLIYFSSEVKQYGLDVLVLLISFVAAHIENWSVRTYWKSLLLGVGGAVFLGISHASVFVLAAVGIGMILRLMMSKAYSESLKLVPMFGIWAASALAIYMLVIAPNNQAAFMKTQWASAFMPFSPLSAAEFKWFPDTFVRLFDNPAGLTVGELAGFLCVCGLFITWKERNYLVLGLALPLVIHLFASACRLYPFTERFLLYGVPAAVILISKGISMLLGGHPQQRILLPGIVLLLIFVPAGYDVYHVFRPVQREEIKESLEYLRGNMKKGDVLYVYGPAAPAFKFYQKAYVEPGTEIHFGEYRITLEGFDNEILPLKGKGRVWLVFSHIYGNDQTKNGIERYIEPLLKDKGEKLDSFYHENTGVSLYTL